MRTNDTIIMAYTAEMQKYNWAQRSNKAQELAEEYAKNNNTTCMECGRTADIDCEYH